MHHRDLVVEALLSPDRAATYSEPQWDLLIRQARRANLLGRLALCIDGERGALRAAWQHLLSARVVAERQQGAIRWEIECIRRALAPTGVPLVLLKGAAYAIAGLPVSNGRMFSDIDVIIPKQAVPTVESALMMNGWVGSHHDSYDQRYYRKWMHEIPPMQHLRRGTVIDVHHAILPETARIRANSSAMREAAVAVPGHADVFVFAPADMVLHSATHLFHEGELDNGLRDLFDLDSLLCHFGATPGFWEQLPVRAAELGLQRPLFYALRYAIVLLGTPVPEPVITAAQQGAPHPAAMPLIDFCFLRGLRVDHPTCADGWTPLARWLLYVRSHWLRMPFFLLLVHLARKAIVPSRQNEAEAAAPLAHTPQHEADEQQTVRAARSGAVDDPSESARNGHSQTL